MPKLTELPVRLAFREEGDYWNCYFCHVENMKDAVLMGCIRTNFLDIDGVKEAFMQAMKLSLSAAVEHATGHKPDVMLERLAREDERTKE